MHGLVRVQTTDGDFPHARGRSVLLCQFGVATCCCCCFTFLLGAFGTGAGFAAGLLRAIRIEPAATEEDRGVLRAGERFLAWWLGLSALGLLTGAGVGFGLDFAFGVRLFHSPLTLGCSLVGVVSGLGLALWFDRKHGWLIVRLLVPLVAATAIGGLVGAGLGYGLSRVSSANEVGWILGGAFGSGAGLALGVCLADPRRRAVQQAEGTRSPDWRRSLIRSVACGGFGLAEGAAVGFGLEILFGGQDTKDLRLWLPVAFGAVGVSVGLVPAVWVNRAGGRIVLRLIVATVAYTALGTLLGAACGFGIDYVFGLLWR